MKIDFESLPLTVGIVGSREFPRLQWVTKFVSQLRPGTVVVSGGARGVDKAAELAAKARPDLPPPVIYLPSKDLPIPARFFDRNTTIIKHVQADRGLVVAFILDPPKTGGTQDSLNKCDRMVVPYVAFYMNGKGKWQEPKVNHVVTTSLSWQEKLFGSPQPNLLPY